MRHTITYALMIVLLIAGTNVFAQSDIDPDKTTSSLEETIKEDIRKKRAEQGKRLTRYEETTLKRQWEFLEAVRNGDLEAATEKMAAKFLYAYDQGGETALTRAIKNQDVDMVRFLEEKAVINLANEAGETPLILAIESNNPEILELIMRRANPTLQDADGVSPLMAALNKGDLGLLLDLIKNGADVNEKSNGVTPLFRAAELNMTKAVAMLAHHGADPSIPNDDGDIALYNAVRNGHNIITGILLQKSQQPGVDANWKTQKEGEPLLNLSIKNDYDQVTRMLLDFGAVTYETDYLENTALNLAAEQGDSELVKILLALGADPNHRNIVGETPIITAAREGHNAVAEALAQAGADPTYKDYNGFMAADNRSFNELELTDPEIVDAVMEMTDGYNE